MLERKIETQEPIEQTPQAIFDYIIENVLNDEKLIPFLEATPSVLVIAASQIRTVENNLNILHYMLTRIRKLPSVNILRAFLDKVDQATIDTLMLQSNVQIDTAQPIDITPYESILQRFRIFYESHTIDTDEYRQYETFACTLLEKTSSDTLNELALKTRFNIRVASVKSNIISALLSCGCSKKVIDAFLLPLSKAIIDDMFQEGFLGASHLYSFGCSNKIRLKEILVPIESINIKQSVIAILPYMSDTRLAQIVKNPFDYQKMKELFPPDEEHILRLGYLVQKISYISFLEIISVDNAELFNLIIKRLLVMGEKIQFTSVFLESINSENLAYLLAQHPEIEHDYLQKKSPGLVIINKWMHAKKLAKYLKTTREADAQLTERIVPLLSIYSLLNTHCGFYQAISLIILNFLENDTIYFERITAESKKIDVLDSLPRELATPVEKKKSPLLSLNLNKTTIFSKFPSPSNELKLMRERRSIKSQYTNKSKKILKDAKDSKKLDSGASSSDYMVKFDHYEQQLDQVRRKYQLNYLGVLLTKWGTFKRTESLDLSMPTSLSSSMRLKLIANLYGYQSKDVARDGNCFFHAIADQINEQKIDCNIRVNHKSLRALAIDFIVKHPDDYRDYLDEHERDLDFFISKNIIFGTWVDHIMISALSRALNMTIAIVRSDGSDPTVIKQAEPIATLVIGHEVGYHYQSLVSDPLLPVTKNLQRFIDKALVDYNPEPLIGLASMGI